MMNFLSNINTDFIKLFLFILSPVICGVATYVCYVENITYGMWFFGGCTVVISAVVAFVAYCLKDFKM